MKYYLFFIVFQISLWLPAQEVFLEGHVTDTLGQNIPYAAVRLLEGSVIKAYTATDTTGFFRLHHLKPGTYTLWINMPGYKDYKQPIDLHRSRKGLMIHLQPAAELLKAVEMRVTRMVETGPGGVRLNVAGTPLENEPDLIAVLRYAPNVSFMNGLQVLGSRRFVLRIDGRKMTMSAGQITGYLQRLKPENIRYIQIREAGDAETGGEQSAEIIIRTKKTLGLSLIPYVNFHYRSAPGCNGGTELYYMKGKFRFWINAFAEYGKTLQWEHRQTFLQNDISYDETGHSHLIRKDAGLTFGTDFYPNDQTSMGIFYDYFYDTDKDYIKNADLRIRTSQNADSLVHSLSRFNHIDNEHLWHVYYEKYIDTLNSYWRLSTEFLLSHFDAPGSKQQDFYTDDSIQAQYHYQNHSHSRYDIYGGEWIREKNTAAGATWKTGVKFSRTFWNYVYHETARTDTLIIHNRTFRFRQDILAPYMNYAFGRGPWKWSFGLRGEWTFNAFGRDEYGRHNRYFPLLPNLKISYQKGAHYTYLYFTKKIRRPAYYLYNPHLEITGRFNAFQGNSKLVPEDIWRWQAAYFYKRNYVFMLRYDFSTNHILNLTSYDTLTARTITHPVNTGRQHHFIFLASLPFKIRNGWTTQTQFYYAYKIFSAPELSHKIISRYPGITHIHRIDLARGLNLKITFDYTGRYGNRNSLYEPSFTASSFLDINLWRRQLKGFLWISDIFNTQHTQYTSYLPDRVVKDYSKYNSRSIGFGLRYVFRKFDQPDDYVPDSILEKEKKRIRK